MYISLGCVVFSSFVSLISLSGIALHVVFVISLSIFFFKKKNPDKKRIMLVLFLQLLHVSFLSLKDLKNLADRFLKM